MRLGDTVTCIARLHYYQTLLLPGSIITRLYCNAAALHRSSGRGVAVSGSAGCYSGHVIPRFSFFPPSKLKGRAEQCVRGPGFPPLPQTDTGGGRLWFAVTSFRVSPCFSSVCFSRTFFSTMAGAIIENMSTKKLVIVGVILLLFQAFSFMVGGLIGKYLFYFIPDTCLHSIQSFVL